MVRGRGPGDLRSEHYPMTGQRPYDGSKPSEVEGPVESLVLVALTSEKNGSQRAVVEDHLPPSPRRRGLCATPSTPRGGLAEKATPPRCPSFARRLRGVRLRARPRQGYRGRARVTGPQIGFSRLLGRGFDLRDPFDETRDDAPVLPVSFPFAVQAASQVLNLGAQDLDQLGGAALRLRFGPNVVRGRVHGRVHEHVHHPAVPPLSERSEFRRTLMRTAPLETPRTSTASASVSLCSRSRSRSWFMFVPSPVRPLRPPASHAPESGAESPPAGLGGVG